ncbi:hypothetical protein CSUB01_08550 [Colletotrichum sublineola]|uniref:Uncharacterized protein n=1 Tax=Colletotrichum sublineola TaxID=1173701 RepID=A0A066X2U4_COLSU|nr:hypothetical protein CSUB01_08550 [Colletotrichum sublineola]
MPDASGRNAGTLLDSTEDPSFYRLSLSFLFSRPIPQHHDVSLCFHDEWLQRDMTKNRTASGNPASYTLHFYRPDHVSLCQGSDPDGLNDDNDPDHPDRRTGQSLCVASINVPSADSAAAPDMVLLPGHAPSPYQSSPRLITLLLLLVVFLFTLISLSILLPLDTFKYKRPQYHHHLHRFTKPRIGLINTNHMLSCYELLLVRLIPLELLHHAPAAVASPSSPSGCAIWWPPQQILSYADTISELSSLVTHGPTTTTTREAFVNLASQAKEAANLIRSFVANDNPHLLELELLLLLTDLNDVPSTNPASTTSSTLSSPVPPPPPPSRKALAKTLASAFLAALQSSNQVLTRLAEQLILLEHHLHQTQLLERVALSNMLEGGIATPEGKATWWSEDVIFNVKRLRQEMMPCRDIVRGLVNEALFGVQAAQEIMVTSIKRLGEVAAEKSLEDWDFAEPTVLIRQVSHVIRYTKELRLQAASWDTGMGASGWQMTVDTPLERRLRAMDERAKTKWEWVGRIWPLGEDKGPEKGEEAFVRERVRDWGAGSGATTPSCTHSSEWFVASSTTRTASTTASRRTTPTQARQQPS